ncbi:hypothetical protein ACFWEJ_09725 [Promicromonospora sp. NPDC060204]|uniref:hypothetical protein n=1 Tax=Promicromonospora sp. NPDC060204 TaxID=3347071 RepID=UPI00365C3EC2
MNIDLVLEFTALGRRTDDEFEDCLERAIARLDEIDRDDVDVSAALAARRATFTVFDVDGRQPGIGPFLAAVWSALYAAGCADSRRSGSASWVAHERQLTLA